ncbi:hypothetical protein WICPIJ_001356 [Wickerhamomyces pijperi]|uniref:acid phosphatase n=1 Tax=Wickerhamomyces pijperi TaxID=599730 RepID=A0A9P8QDU1_WICPI|nr:hypothetical protein WICPIJ_001356 [Wickerhamomyces pijperi]
MLSFATLLPLVSLVLAKENLRTYSAISPKASDIAVAAATASTAVTTSDVEGAAFNRFVVIWLENTDFDKAAESEGLSYLAQYGVTLDNYWALTHPSEPNYMAAVGGDYFGLDDDRFIALPKNVSSIVDLLDEKNISWAEYQEHLPYTGFQGFNYSNQETFANDYVRKHNPLILYDSVADDADRLSHIKNFTQFEYDLANEQLPQWSFITPNMTNDAHDTTIEFSANWAKNFIKPLLENEYFMNETLVLLTFDENETYADKNKVFALLFGGAVPESLHGTVDSTFYNHYSEIASVEANWNLHNLGRHDAAANVFDIVAKKTNVTNDEVDTTYLVNNQTYTGYLNDASQELPAPNVNAVNKVGKGVLPAISSLWAEKYTSQSSAGFFTSTTTTISTGSIHDATTTASASKSGSASGSASVKASGSASATASSAAASATKSTGAGNTIQVAGLTALFGFVAALAL